MCVSCFRGHRGLDCRSEYTNGLMRYLQHSSKTDRWRGSEGSKLKNKRKPPRATLSPIDLLIASPGPPPPAFQTLGISAAKFLTFVAPSRPAGGCPYFGPGATVAMLPPLAVPPPPVLQGKGKTTPPAASILSNSPLRSGLWSREACSTTNSRATVVSCPATFVRLLQLRSASISDAFTPASAPVEATAAPATAATSTKPRPEEKGDDKEEEEEESFVARERRKQPESPTFATVSLLPVRTAAHRVVPLRAQSPATPVTRSRCSRWQLRLVIFRRRRR